MRLANRYQNYNIYSLFGTIETMHLLKALTMRGTLPGQNCTSEGKRGDENSDEINANY